MRHSHQRRRHHHHHHHHRPARIPSQLRCCCVLSLGKPRAVTAVGPRETPVDRLSSTTTDDKDCILPSAVAEEEGAEEEEGEQREANLLTVRPERYFTLPALFLAYPLWVLLLLNLILRDRKGRRRRRRINGRESLPPLSSSSTSSGEPTRLASGKRGSMTTQFTKLFSFIIASVNDPPPAFPPAYHMQCHSCMSPYLEDQFMYISHLYRRPLAFSEKCDRNNFDWRYLRTKNCTDACVTLRMNDKVGGRRRFGYMRGCLSDIIHYNRSVVRVGADASTIGGIRSVGGGGAKPLNYHSSYCTFARLRDLFVSSDRYAFDPTDHVELCTCVQPLCNRAAAGDRSAAALALMFCCVAATVVTAYATTTSTSTSVMGGVGWPAPGDYAEEGAADNGTSARKRTSGGDHFRATRDRLQRLCSANEFDPTIAWSRRRAVAKRRKRKAHSPLGTGGCQ